MGWGGVKLGLDSIQRSGIARVRARARVRQPCSAGEFARVRVREHWSVSGSGWIWNIAAERKC